MQPFFYARTSTAGSDVDENSSVKLYLAKECSPEALDSIFRCRTPRNGSAEQVQNVLALTVPTLASKIIFRREKKIENTRENRDLKN